MNTGILITTHLGTVYILEDETSGQSRAEHLARRSGLKLDPTGEIVLVPQPSDDPNDPLVGLRSLYVV
jgi:hypothetical protein